MKITLEHLPEDKQRELARVVEIIHEQFSDALEGSSTAFKKRGRILKIILFGSYARDTFVDDPHTMKGYTSDFDILVLVSNRKLAEPQYWDRASDRLKWDKAISPLVGPDRVRCESGQQLPRGGAVFLRRYPARGDCAIRTRRAAARGTEGAWSGRCSQDGKGAFRQATQQGPTVP